MKAAVLHTAGNPPRFEEFPEPVAGEGEVLVHVRAAALHPLTKSLASGAHYASRDNLPAVCGADGVGVLDDGTRVYFGGSRAPFGTMAERAVAYKSWVFPIPDDLDDSSAAALPNPAMSSWIALAWRALLQLGETVLILGATGAAGRLAVQIAKHLGAGRVVAAGRNSQILRMLQDRGADATIALDQPDQVLSAAFARESAHKKFDVVLDYVWGHPTEGLLDALTGHDAMAESSRVRLVEIGAMAGPTIALPAAALRSSAIEIYGSGGGSIPHQAIFDTLPQVMALAASGKLHLDIEQVPLAEIERAWDHHDPHGRRLVIVP
jgi:NADPH:quinone reductase-like Zn-dependent oxidoreductase